MLRWFCISISYEIVQSSHMELREISRKNPFMDVEGAKVLIDSRSD
jgi:hypothetical protein